MADSKVENTLLTVPLEIRYRIFDHAAARDIKPKKMLRYWFEKKEVKQLIAKEAADNPNGVAPQPVYANDDEYDSEVDDGQDEQEGGSDHEEDEEGEDSEDEEFEEQGIPEDNDENDETEQASESEDGTMDAGDDQEIEEGLDAGDDNENNEDHSITTTTAAAQTALPTPAPAPLVKPHRKWRHIPKFMRITRCPPPVELMLVSKQLNEEAKNWFYNVAVLNIEATGSFSHTSFFEETFTQITEAAFSPMENIRKVDVTFVWDSAWIKAEETGIAYAIFPSMLRERATFVLQILRQAPDLREVVIHWHDSEQDDESTLLRLEILEPFYTLNAEIDIQEHYIPAHAKPHRKSIAGRRRVEFQAIADAHFESLN